MGNMATIEQETNREPEQILNGAEGLKSRRSALLLGGAALAGLALSSKAEAQSATMDAEILNFALNLEFLEAQYYTLATTGLTIDKISSNPGVITSGGGAAGGTVTVKANPMVPFTAGSPVMNYAMETAQEERNHVAFLQSALNANGANASVQMPNIDLLNSFNTLGSLLGLPSFDPFASEAAFLLGSFIFEDVGVTAYLGAAPLISSSAYLSAALGIHAVEAYHAGSIRTQLFANSMSATPTLVGGLTLDQISQAIAGVRAKLDGSNPPDDIGVGTTTTPTLGAAGTTLTASTIVDVSFSGPSPARVVPRTTSQVLNIVYGGGAAGTGGLFFPNGMNGSIK